MGWEARKNKMNTEEKFEKILNKLDCHDTKIEEMKKDFEAFRHFSKNHFPHLFADIKNIWKTLTDFEEKLKDTASKVLSLEKKFIEMLQGISNNKTIMIRVLISSLLILVALVINIVVSLFTKPKG